MDCRRGLVLGLALALATTSGCVLTQGTTHKASTYVAYGDMRSAAGGEATPEQLKEAREMARLAYIKAIDVDPKCLPAYLGLARLQKASDDPSTALPMYQKALQLSDKNATLWYELGMCQVKVKQWEPGVASLKKAVDLDKKNRQYASSLGYALVMAGQPHEGFAVLARLNGEAKAHLEMARLMHHLKNAEQAQIHRAEAARLDPTLAALSRTNTEPTGSEVMQTKYIAPGPPPDAIATPTSSPTIMQGGEIQKEGATGKALDVPAPPVLSIRSR